MRPVPLGRRRGVPFNDLASLERELAQGDVACVITEPALTNVGIVLPQPGFHEGLRELTRKANVLLIVGCVHLPVATYWFSSSCCTDLSGDPPLRGAAGKDAGGGPWEPTPTRISPSGGSVEELGPDRSLSSFPLFQVMFQLHNVPGEDLALPELSVAPLTVEADTAKFNLTLGAVECGGELIEALEYSTDLWDEATIERMSGSLAGPARLGGPGVRPPSRRLSELNMLRASRSAASCWEAGTPPPPPAPDICIHQLFEAQAARTPDAVAVAGDGRELTYRQLDRRANRLAHHLRSLGVGPEVLVGICVQRSPEMVMGLLRHPRSQPGAYVPLDPSHPPERLALVAADAAISVVVSTEHLQAAIPAFHRRSRHARRPGHRLRPRRQPAEQDNPHQHRLPPLHLRINRPTQRRCGLSCRRYQPAPLDVAGVPLRVLRAVLSEDGADIHGCSVGNIRAAAGRHSPR